jgi:hypothetical protein
MNTDDQICSAMIARNLELHPSDELKNHPLWPNIFEWLLESPHPVVTWSHHSVFFSAVDALPSDEFEKEQFRREFNESELLRRAMVGGTYHQGDHAVLYCISSHRLGNALCYAAGLAWILREHRAAGVDDFAESLRKEGFITALESWLRRKNIAAILPSDLDALGEIPWVHKLSESGKNEAANYFLSALPSQIGDSGAFIKAIVNADGNARRDAAKLIKNRKDGVKPQQPAEFSSLIEHLWIPWALWTKTDEGIVATLQPNRKRDLIEAQKLVGNNVSALGFSASRLKKDRSKI